VRLGALDPEWRLGRRENPAGVSFLCPGCGQHTVTVWLRPPLDGGAEEPDELTHRWDSQRSGLGGLTVFGVVVLAPCWRGRIVDGELLEIRLQ
jgi:hypothetical protein